MIPRIRRRYRSSRATFANCSRPWIGFWSYINVSSLPLNTSPRTVRERAPVPPSISNVGPRYIKPLRYNGQPDLWVDRCRAAEIALAERKLVAASSAAESALAAENRLREDAERQAGHMRPY
jgi:hypothetical protein